MGISTGATTGVGSITSPQLLPLVEGLFSRARRRSTRVAVEHELLVLDAASGGVVPIERVGRVLGRGPARRCVGFEPGGQLELSLPAVASPAALGRQVGRRLTRVTARLADHGIRLAACPVDPRPDVPLQLTSPRYVAMQRHFDTIGPAGRVMMRRTAATQVCLDWWPGEAGYEQWRVLNLAGPFVAATFARSAGPAGRLTTWLGVDSDRTGFDDRLLQGDDPEAAYAAFAAGAAPFVTSGLTAHLTTLFPPVRPRGRYLEVRFLDVQEADVVEHLVSLLAGLMYDDVHRRTVLRSLAPELPRLGEHWRAAADGDAEVAARGRAVLGLPEVVSAA